MAGVDTGLDYQHPDMAENGWGNPGEDLNGNGRVDPDEWNGIDDDGNGFIDDLRGFDFADSVDGDADGSRARSRLLRCAACPWPVVRRGARHGGRARLVTEGRDRGMVLVLAVGACCTQELLHLAQLPAGCHQLVQQGGNVWVRSYLLQADA